MDPSDVVHQVVAQHREEQQEEQQHQQEQPQQEETAEQQDGPPTSDPEKQDRPGPLVKIPDAPPPRNAHYRTPPTTPSMRTGPPRTLSYIHSHPNSPSQSRANSKHENDQQQHGTSPASAFRDALELATPIERKGKKRDAPRESWFAAEEAWNLNPMRWFHDSPRGSPKEEVQGFNFNNTAKSEAALSGQATPENQTPQSAHPDGNGGGDGASRIKGALRRANSVPHGNTYDKSSRSGASKWEKLKSLMPNVSQQSQQASAGGGQSAVAAHSVNITDELITGGLSTLMLRLWFERDEKDHRRVPVLLHRLRIRISDSLHPLEGSKAVFRIECEYANGAARWVVYRQLRDFLSLHAHYSVSNVYNRNVDHMPEFPRTSKCAFFYIRQHTGLSSNSVKGLPYFKFLKKEGKEKGNQIGHQDFARMQREALENYILDLIRAVVRLSIHLCVYFVV